MIAFYHHPLMSREHVLASKMSELYEAYIKHRQKNYAIFYQEKLRTLRLALKTMKRYSSLSPERHGEWKVFLHKTQPLFSSAQYYNTTKLCHLDI